MRHSETQCCDCLASSSCHHSQIFSVWQQQNESEQWEMSAMNKQCKKLDKWIQVSKNLRMQTTMYNILSFRLQGQERGEGIKENIITKRAMLAAAPWQCCAPLQGQAGLILPPSSPPAFLHIRILKYYYHYILSFYRLSFSKVQSNFTNLRWLLEVDKWCLLKINIF